MGEIVGLFVLLGFLIVFWFPTVIAYSRKHRNAPAILATNLLLGWTGVAWIVAVIWAFSDNVKEKT